MLFNMLGSAALNFLNCVIPAKAGIQLLLDGQLDSRFRGNDVHCRQVWIFKLAEKPALLL
jgi:hypothetical protein